MLVFIINAIIAAIIFRIGSIINENIKSGINKYYFGCVIGLIVLSLTTIIHNIIK